jgi:predicted GNAT family acetyltransferase
MRVSDRDTIRAVLETDRPWAAYALADLSPKFFPHATWFCSTSGAPALALVYRAFATSVLITLGPAREVEPLLCEMDETLTPSELYLAVQPEIVPLLRARYVLSQEKVMQRMVLDPARHATTATATATRLGPADLQAVERLHADGAASGEAPHWFLPEMLSDGVYYGVYEGRELTAVAGTHVVSLDEGVGCLGGIYTRRDRRGQGLSTRVTGAVAAELRGMRLQTIALNVAEDNAAAVRVYDKLGFDRACSYVEAVARKRR